MFAYKPTKRRGTVDLSILTDNNQLIEYSLEFRQKSITKYVAARIRNVFSSYLVDTNTDIAINELLDEDHPLYQYFMFLRQHIGFKISTVTIGKAVSRIHYFYRQKSAPKSRFNKVWKLIIDKQQCPWITTNIDYAIQNKGPSLAYRIKVSRMLLFYLVVKKYLYKIKKKSTDKASMNV